MIDLRSRMESALKVSVVPLLRDKGFMGSFPHFRRAGELGVDLLTFQFDRNGGGFVIEITRAVAGSFTTHWGKEIPANKVTAWDLHPDKRKRIKPAEGAGTDTWFRFDNGNVEQAAQQVVAKLPLAEAWWSDHFYLAI